LDTIIRPAQPADRAELLRVRGALFPNNPDELAEVDAYLSGALTPAALLVAQRIAGGLAGFIEVGTRPYAEGCLTSPVAYVEAWYVDEDMRRRGVGRALFNAAEAWAREQRLTEIASDALIDNAVSIAAHKALGYEEVERIVCFRRSLTG
jgi:aminoglycoside 6'-N-acetyltransferase I